MPPDPLKLTVDWLKRLRDGRTLLAAGDSDGVVRLWDPATLQPTAEVFQRPGRPVIGMAVAEGRDLLDPFDIDLITVYEDHKVDVWSPGSVHGERSTMAPAEAKLLAVAHQRLVGVATSALLIGGSRPMLLVDRNGTVTMWHTYGTRVWDVWSPDPAHRDVVAVTALPWLDGGTAVVPCRPQPTGVATRKRSRIARPTRRWTALPARGR
jgi:hypothetical protein